MSNGTKLATPLCMDLLRHTLGDETCYRNHFCAGPNHYDWEKLQVLVRAGYMVSRPAPSWCEGGEVIFHATETGKAAAWEASNA